MSKDRAGVPFNLHHDTGTADFDYEGRNIRNRLEEKYFNIFFVFYFNIYCALRSERSNLAMI